MKFEMKKSVTLAVVIVSLSAIVACSQTARNSLTAPSGVAGALGEASPNSDTRMLRGEAVVTQMPGLTYANTIEAKLNAAGEASGSFLVRVLDTSAFGEDNKATAVGDINCLEFAGDTVWFGGAIKSATNKDLLEPPFVNTIGQVKVTGGQSYLFSGPALFYAAPGTTCKDRPSLPIQPVTKGGFQIK